MNAFPGNTSMLELSIPKVILWTDIEPQACQRCFIKSKIESNYERIEVSK